MDRKTANKILASLGYPDATVEKAEGIWYLLGDDPKFVNQNVERCLHVVRLDDLDEDVLNWKLGELTRVDEDSNFKPVTLGERLIPGCSCGWAESCRCD